MLVFFVSIKRTRCEFLFTKVTIDLLWMFLHLTTLVVLVHRGVLILCRLRQCICQRVGAVLHHPPHQLVLNLTILVVLVH